MAKVEWSAGIDHVSGALSKPGKNGQHSCAKMLLGTHRTAATQSSDCNRLYLRKKVKRTSPLKPKEVAARQRFQANFAAQKDQAGGKKTMKAYLWKVCGDIYDAAHNG